MATYYTEDHEWIHVEDGKARVGITAHAAEQLGEVVYVELKEAGERFAKGDELGVIESVKAASEVYAPVSGEIVEANSAVVDRPNLLNDTPEGDAWLYKISLADSSELAALMDLDSYKASLA
ncbi:MAG: glycine cleavage system protein GcvH [Rhodospirillales bacterium]|nr:glycine cleavage system protein GcvH [Rhodospirillales bacterium]